LYVLEERGDNHVVLVFDPFEYCLLRPFEVISVCFAVVATEHVTSSDGGVDFDVCTLQVGCYWES
jgi:hypothetical protein